MFRRPNGSDSECQNLFGNDPVSVVFPNRRNAPGIRGSGGEVSQAEWDWPISTENLLNLASGTAAWTADSAENRSGRSPLETFRPVSKSGCIWLFKKSNICRLFDRPGRCPPDISVPPFLFARPIPGHFPVLCCSPKRFLKIVAIQRPGAGIGSGGVCFG